MGWEKYLRLNGLNNRNYSFMVLEERSPRSKYQQVWFPLRSLTLACRCPPSPSVLTWLFLTEHSFWYLCPCLYLLFNKATSGLEPAIRPHFNLITSLQAPPLSPVTYFWVMQFSLNSSTLSTSFLPALLLFLLPFLFSLMLL